MLIDHDDADAEFTALPQKHIHQGFLRPFLLSIENMMRFLDDDYEIKILSSRRRELDVVQPQAKHRNQKAFSILREPIEFDDCVLPQQILREGFLLDGGAGGELRECETLKRPNRRRFPRPHFSAVRNFAEQLQEKFRSCNSAFLLAQSKRSLNQASRAIAQRERIGENIDNLINVHNRFKSGRNDKRVERERQKRSPRREDLYWTLEIWKQMASGALPVEEKKWNTPLGDLLKQNERDVCFSRAAPTVDCEILQQLSRR